MPAIVWILLLASALTHSLAHAAEYQWSALVGGEDRRAYLWIPDNCQRLRGLVVDVKNLTEHALVEHPAVREACRQARVGIVWLAEDRTAKGFARSALGSGWGWPACLPPDQRSEYERLEGEFAKGGTHPTPEQQKDRDRFLTLRRDLAGRAKLALDDTLEALARESGYDEIRQAPLLILSHSMGGRACWGPMAYAYWIPERIWGAIPIKTGVGRGLPPEKPDASMAGVPVLYINQIAPEAASAEWTADATQGGRQRDELIGQVFDWGGSHFEMTDEMARLVALFITKAARYRLSEEIPATGLPTLKPLGADQGWLAGSLLERNPLPPAPAAGFAGDKAKALWYFDEEMARAALGHHRSERGKKPQYPTISSNGILLRPIAKHFHEISIPRETAVDDGFTFKLVGSWQVAAPNTDRATTTPIGHSPTGLPVVRPAGGGNLVQLDTDTFRYRQFHRGPVGHGWLVAYHPGDDDYCRANYQAMIWLELAKTGKPQRLTFPAPPDVPAGTSEITLEATSDVPGQVVEYYVVSGPAELIGKDPRYTGSTLRLTPLPPRSRFPVTVTVVAYQPGRRNEPLVQAAPEVVREFHITDPGH